MYKKFQPGRKKVLERDLNECKKCCSKYNLNVHHIDNNTDNQELNNLVVLCSSCHNKLTHSPRPYIYTNMMRRLAAQLKIKL